MNILTNGKVTRLHRSMVIAASLAAGLALGACGRSSGGSVQRAEAQGVKAEVLVSDFKFDPGQLDVPVGTTVRWTNQDAVLHTVTSGDFSGARNIPDGRFDGRLEHAAATFERVFDTPGIYTYFCSQHNIMNGTIRVK